MVITVDLSPAIEKEVRRLASRQGVPLEQYVSSLIARSVNRAAALDELLRPIRDGFAAAGVGEEEAAILFEGAREAVWSARKTTSNPL